MWGMIFLRCFGRNIGEFFRNEVRSSCRTGRLSRRFFVVPEVALQSHSLPQNSFLNAPLFRSLSGHLPPFCRPAWFTFMGELIVRDVWDEIELPLRWTAFGLLAIVQPLTSRHLSKPSLFLRWQSVPKRIGRFFFWLLEYKCLAQKINFWVSRLFFEPRHRLWIFGIVV